MADEQAILQDPSAHNADDVIDALAGVSEDELALVKARESEGKQRKTILEYLPPSLASAGASFETDERHSLEGWKERAAWFEFDGRPASPHAIAGALHELEPGARVSQGNVRRLLAKFAERQS